MPINTLRAEPASEVLNNNYLLGSPRTCLEQTWRFLNRWHLVSTSCGSRRRKDKWRGKSTKVGRAQFWQNQKCLHSSLVQCSAVQCRICTPAGAAFITCGWEGRKGNSNRGSCRKEEEEHCICRRYQGRFLRSAWQQFLNKSVSIERRVRINQFLQKS